MTFFIKILCTCFQLSICLMIAMCADISLAEEIEFDETFLNSGAGTGDLKTFQGINYVRPGVYDLDIYLNDSLVKREPITFFVDPDGDTVPMINVKLLERLGVDVDKARKDHAIPTIVEDNESDNLVPKLVGSSVEFAADKLELKISIPQIYLKIKNRGSVDPSLWDNGISAAFSDYQTNFYRSKNYGEQSDYYNINLRNGFNIAGWRFRNESAYTQGSKVEREFKSNRSYLEKDINSLKSKLSIGELFAGGDIFESYRFKGIQLGSELGMLSDSEIGYAPVVRGIAESNAVVEVKQNGFIIYSASVPPGPFEFRDINPSGSNGDILIRILESDGRIKEYTQSFAYQPVMTRKGNFRYSLTFGEYSSTDLPSPSFAQGTAVYGALDNITGFGGFISSPRYSSLNTGVGLNSPYGGISFDVTTSESKNYNGASDHGYSSRVLYSKTLNATRTTFTMAGYRYSTEGYRTFNQHVSDQQQRERFSQTIIYRNPQKSRFNLRVNQTLSQNKSVYISLEETAYWRYKKPSKNWQLGFNGSTQKFSYGIAVARTQGPNSYSSGDSQVTLSISVPLGSGSNTHNFSSSVVSSKENGAAYQSSISGFVDSNQKYGYTASVGNNKSSGTSTGATLNADTSVVKIQGGFNQGSNSEQMNIGASGSVVAHSNGVTFGQPVGDTFGLIEVPNVDGVGVSGWTGIKTNRKGFAVVPYMQAYRYNWMNLDTESIGTDTEINENSKVVVPTRGSIVKVAYSSTTGRRIQFSILDDSGKHLPLGAQVLDQNSKPVGLVDNQSKALIFGIPDQGKLKVIWEGSECSLPYVLPEKDPKLTYQDVKGTCSM